MFQLFHWAKSAEPLRGNEEKENKGVSEHLLNILNDCLDLKYLRASESQFPIQKA